MLRLDHVPTGPEVYTPNLPKNIVARRRLGGSILYLRLGRIVANTRSRTLQSRCASRRMASRAVGLSRQLATPRSS
eukprot:5832481-Pleurochrysis_carterae.AAC.2